MAQGQPGMLPSDPEAELTTICGVDPRPLGYLAESEMPGPAMDAVHLLGAGGTAHEAEGLWRMAL